MYSIYWIENNTRCGPTTVPDMLGRVQRGELTPDTPGWHKGCAGWVPLRELPALADFLVDKAEIPPPAQEPTSAPAAAPEPPKEELHKQLLNLVLPGPGSRLLARLIDIALYATLVLGFMHMFEMPYILYLQPGSPLFWLPFPALEMLLLYCWHTTPGKWWLGIRLQPLRGKFSMGVLLLRSVLVFCMGMGCMILPFSLLAMLLSYLMVKRSGVTVWDMHSASLPVHARRPGIVSTISALCLLYVAMQLCGQYMLPWMPDILQSMHEQFPQWANMMEEAVKQASQQP